MGRAKPPPILDATPEQIEHMLNVARQQMPAELFAIIEASVVTNAWLIAELRKQKASLRRLRKLMGINSSEKTRNVIPPSSDQNEPTGTDTAAQDEQDDHPATPSKQQPETKPDKPKPKGHGRLGAADYPTAEHVFIPHESLHAGEPCPDCGGRLYRFRNSAVLRILGRSLLQPRVEEFEQLRCANCLRVFTASGSKPRYDESATAVVAVFHYQAGMPLHRLADVQQQLQVAVPASTQWDLLNDGADVLRPVFDELVNVAASGNVLHIDDSYVRILEWMGKRREQLVAESKLETPERTGLFTTAVVSILDVGPVALFFNGRQHAGENVADVLTHRDQTLPSPILMSDALNRNVPKGHDVIEANCMSHARRGIVNEVVNYPDACWVVLDSLARIYKLDGELQSNGTSADERLFAHQRHSIPILDELHDWMQGAIDSKAIEPNSGMGQALSYFLKHWSKLTLFVREAGAPIDNNIAERILKLAIRYRRNSLFYRNQRGALVGDIYMTLIHTAVLHKANPVHYLTSLLGNAADVRAAPQRWLPWNFEDTLANLQLRQPA